MRWREPVKRLPMAGSDRQARKGEEKGRVWADRRNEIQQRASILHPDDNQFGILSQSRRETITGEC